MNRLFSDDGEALANVKIQRAEYDERRPILFSG
jgi:hypothetical protein